MGSTAEAVAAVIDGRADANTITVKPFTAYTPDADGNKPRGRPALPDDQRSQSAEALRARRRREEAKKRGTMPAAAPSSETRVKMTPADVREPPALPPGPPVAIVPAPDVTERAVKFFAFILKFAGVIAASILKDDGMKVPDADATETAAAVVDGWPELAIMDVDGKKFLAAAAVGSLVVERYGRYRPRGVPAAPAAPPPTNLYTGEPMPAKVSEGLPMQPVSM